MYYAWNLLGFPNQYWKILNHCLFKNCCFPSFSVSLFEVHITRCIQLSYCLLCLIFFLHIVHLCVSMLHSDHISGSQAHPVISPLTISNLLFNLSIFYSNFCIFYFQSICLWFPLPGSPTPPQFACLLLYSLVLSCFQYLLFFLQIYYFMMCQIIPISAIFDNLILQFVHFSCHDD